MQHKRNYGLIFGLVLLSFASLTPVHAEEGRVTVGMGVGLSLLTQEATATSDSSIGPAINLHALYGINDSLSAGFLFEWERRSFDQEQPDIDLGSLNTITLMPILTWHFGSYGRVFPYLSTGIGVNVNSFSEDDAVGNTQFDFANTFAWRLAGGADFPLTEDLFLNGEVAWKRNRGSLTTGNTEGNFDASSLNLNVGLRYMF